MADEQLVVIGKELYDRVGGFIRRVAMNCKDCQYNQGDYLCDACVAKWAQALHKEYAVASRHFETPEGVFEKNDCSLKARMFRVVEILKAARRPLRGRDIDLSNYCDGTNKEFTLRSLVRQGRIVTFKRGSTTLYRLPWGSDVYDNAK